MKDGVAPGIVLGDAGHGCDGAFRAGVTALGLTYAVGVGLASRRRAIAAQAPERPARKPSRVRHDADHKPVSAKQLAMRLPAEAWKDVEWREGSNQTLSSRFAAVRLRPASRDHKLMEPHPVGPRASKRVARRRETRVGSRASGPSRTTVSQPAWRTY